MHLKLHIVLICCDLKSQSRFITLICFLLPLIIFTSCNKEVSTTPEDTLISNNHLFVYSAPPGSAIFLDNRNTGQFTPDTLTWVGAGDHIVTLKKKLFENFSLPVHLDENENDTLFFDYYHNPLMLGRIYVDSEPRGANIYLNDTATGFNTPKAIEGLFPGEYKVGYKLTGYWDLETTVMVTSNKSITVDKRLIDTLQWVNFNSGTAGLPTNYYNAIAVQNGYIKWIGSNNAGLIRYDDNEWVVYNTENSGIPSNKILSLEIDANSIWAGTDNGAVHFANGQWTIYNTGNSPLQSDQITCIKVDPSGKVWMATFNKGIYVLDGNSWTVYNSLNSPLPTDFINTIFIEENGTVWIGTYGEGLIKYNGITWTIYTAGLPPSKNVISILINNTDIWAGCHSFGLLNGGIAERKSNTWQILQPYPAWAIIRAADNSLWFGTDGNGLMEYADQYWRSYNVLNSRILSNKVTGVAIDGSGNKWVSTFGGGISKFKGSN